MKALVVDDSAVYRKLVSNVLSKFSDITEISTAANGELALKKIESENPDFVTLDVEMPGLSGIEVLEKLVKRKYKGDAIIISSQTKSGAEIAIRSLKLGALDVVAKPEGKGFEDSLEKLYIQLRPIVDGIIIRHKLKSAAHKKEVQAAKPQTTPKSLKDPGAIVSRMAAIANQCKPKIVAIGASTGGPNALADVLRSIPKSFKIPIVIVLHIPAAFTEQLVKTLNAKSAVSVVEAASNQKLEAGVAYLAPGGKQMKVVKDAENHGFTLILNDDPPENHCKPSVDYLFRSVATAYRGDALGVILTGMGADGVKGLKRMKRFNVRVIAQDESTCVVFGMPAEAIKSGVVDIILPLNDIAGKIVELAR